MIRAGPGTRRPSSVARSMPRRNTGARSPLRKRRCSVKPRSVRGRIVLVVARLPVVALQCLWAVAFLAVIAGNAVGAEQRNGKEVSISAFDIEAHRGGRALFPENTLASFANALSMGVDTLELDIGVTRDGAV